MKPKDVAQNLEVGRGRLVEIEPEEAVAGEEALDGGAVEVNLFRTLVVDHVAGRRTRAICARFSISGAWGSARGRRPIGL
jgi:hypothetical protein